MSVNTRPVKLSFNSYVVRFPRAFRFCTRPKWERTPQSSNDDRSLLTRALVVHLQATLLATLTHSQDINTLFSSPAPSYGPSDALYTIAKRKVPGKGF